MKLIEIYKWTCANHLSTLAAGSQDELRMKDAAQQDVQSIQTFVISSASDSHLVTHV